MFVFSIRGVPDSVRARPAPSMADVLATKSAMKRKARGNLKKNLINISPAHNRASIKIIKHT